MALCWKLSSVSCTEEPRTGHSTSGEASPVLSRGEELPPLTCPQSHNVVQDTFCLVCGKDTLLLQVQLDVHQEPQVLFYKAAFQVCSPQHILVHFHSTVSMLPILKLLHHEQARCIVFFDSGCLKFYFQTVWFTVSTKQLQYHNTSELGPPILMR